MRATAATRLEFALLGLIRLGVQSGYALRKQFASTPMGNLSDSPGSIYPALKRLERRGWIRPSSDGRGPRRKRLLGVTKSGQAALLKWMTAPIRRQDILRHSDDLLLRFAFMGRIAGRSTALIFLRNFERGTSQYVRELHSFIKAMPSEPVPTGALALENGLMQYETHARWARRALARLRRMP